MICLLADFDQRVVLPFNKFTIAYAGRFQDKKNTSRSLLQALKELHCEQPELATEIQVVFAGMFEGQSRDLLKQWDIEEMVKPL